MPASRALAACAALVVALPAFAVEDTATTSAARPRHRHVARHASRAATTSDASSSGTGNASFYSRHLAGKKTASGERYDPEALTAAHRTLPLGTRVKVVNPKTEQSVVVTVNDRGPVPKNRVLDVSSAAADRLGMKQAGVTKVQTEVVGKADLPKPGPGVTDVRR